MNQNLCGKNVVGVFISPLLILELVERMINK